MNMSLYIHVLCHNILWIAAKNSSCLVCLFVQLYCCVTIDNKRISFDEVGFTAQCSGRQLHYEISLIYIQH